MHASLLDVLRCLGSQAADSLVDCFREKRALSAARLACRALRTFIDSNTTSLTITVRAADLQRWEAAGQRRPPPSLAVRWPRCRHLTLKIMDGPGGMLARIRPSMVAEDMGLLALLPFVEPGAGRHIESLKVSQGNYYNYDTYAGTYGESLVCRLVPLLPNLRDLDFGLPECMSFTSLHQQLMYATLASLPRLERLTLPGCRSLDHVGALAASLRCLRIIERDGGDHLSAAAIAGLLQLQQLEELELPCFELGADGGGSEVASSSGIQALLRATLPASLQQLRAGLAFDDGEDAILSLRLGAGRWSHVTISTESNLELSNLAALAQQLLRSPAMGPTLELFSIEGLLTLEDNLGDRQQADLVQLRTLIQRCAKVKTSSVWISSAAPAAAVMGLLPLLWPDEVTLQFNGGYEVGLPFPCANGEMPGISGPTLGMSTGAVVNSSSDVAAPPATEGLGFQRQCSPPPGPADLHRAALQRMAVGGGPSSSQQAASSNAEGGTPVPPVTGSMPGGSLLLLQGPFLPLIATHGMTPTEWVQCVAAKADAAAPGNDWGGKPVLSCQEVPLVNGVLVSCSSATAAAAVAAAAGGALDAAAPVQFVHLQSASPGNIKEGLFNALELVMTTFWKGTAHGCGDCTLQTRLRCLLELWQAFNALPEEVNL